MKRLMLSTVIILGCIFIMEGCSNAPSESAIQTAIALTNEANPSATNSPEPSSTSTKTLIPTQTATLTKTPTPTRTPTVTPPPPMTQTAIAFSISRTQISADKTSTASALSAQRTITAYARSIRATEIASYTAVPWRDLITYPDKYKGQRVKISGQVFNINGDDQLQMWVGNYEAVYVVMKNSFSDIYENSWIIVYGVGQGENCGENAYGAEICQALIVDAFYVFP